MSGETRETAESRVPNPESRLVKQIRGRAPLTVAAFMELALYDPQDGYYARAAQRSGRAGDFFTSVDVGPLFGELLEIQLSEIAGILRSRFGVQNFDLVEAGAGNGRLSTDILRAARERSPVFYDSIRLHLVEASAHAREAQRTTLDDVAGALRSSGPSMPESFEGVLLANELLDALPAHQVVMREDGLREGYVVQSGDRLALTEGPPSTPRLAEYLDRLGVTLQPGWRAEINLRAVEWVKDAARRLRRGFMILIDYGHEARELYSVTHASGTLTGFSRHRSAGPELAAPAWLENPGEQDLTAHVDFTSVRTAAEEEGMTAVGLLDQTYFLMGLLTAGGRDGHDSLHTGQSTDDSAVEPLSAARNAQLKTLVMPGGLGSTLKVLILGKNVGAPALAGCSFKMRVT